MLIQHFSCFGSSRELFPLLIVSSQNSSPPSWAPLDSYTIVFSFLKIFFVNFSSLYISPLATRSCLLDNASFNLLFYYFFLRDKLYQCPFFYILYRISNHYVIYIYDNILMYLSFFFYFLISLFHYNTQNIVVVFLTEDFSVLIRIILISKKFFCYTLFSLRTKAMSARYFIS